MKTRDINKLEQKARAIRMNILESIGINKKGHLGGSMSSADLVTALYFYKMQHSPAHPLHPDRDRFIFSKGHSVLAQYAALAESGYFPKTELKQTKTLGSILQGHPERDTPGVEANTGSLGQGLSIGLGMALGGKLDQRTYQVYVILGDGELAEGQIWEAVLAAKSYQVDNLVAIVDHNKLQASGPVKEGLKFGGLKRKFTAFGWHAMEIDGHNMKEIIEALDLVEQVKGTPAVIIANTVKGKGVLFAENKAEYHNVSLSQQQFEQAKSDIANL